MPIKVLSVPHLDQLGKGESGIVTVVRNYFRLAREYDIEFVPPKTDSFDVLAIHAGSAGNYPKNGNIVAHTHGLYFTGDYEMPSWAYAANEHVIESVRHAKVVTTPSSWVGEIFRRDMRIAPIVLPHGINVSAWARTGEMGNYVIGYAKNRAGMDVCDPSFLEGFTAQFPNVPFVSTFPPNNNPPNLTVTGVLAHDDMREMVKGARVFINTTKETFGIAMLEAMAAGVPVLAFDHGGATDIVKHGVNGYLARPGDYNDLAAGLAYCYDHAPTLGANGAHLARNFSWDESMRILHDIYYHAMIQEPPTVGVVIPVYNKTEEQVIRALDSVKGQTYAASQIVVVDDGSNSGVDYQALAQERGAEYLIQENSGVAAARNRGIDSLNTKYVLCLDADDALEPLFLEACVPELEADNSLGIAYTGLQWIKPDGSTGLSEWPGDYDFDKFIKGQNQVPTACVFRREAWKRTGGYHSRYCPYGAGEEDANLWLRMGAIGYGAKKVTTAGLFLYSWQSGQVSGDKQHVVSDWRAMLPWTKDDIHPIASRARAKRRSHPVFQRDEPVVSVIIPVGPGHEAVVKNALDSLEAQTYRSWEAVVVWDSGTLTGLTGLERSYPYARIAYSQGDFSAYDIQPYIVPKPVGAGRARNRGVMASRAPFLLFLDADDQLHPDAIEKMLDAYGKTGAAIYSDYVGRAVIDDLSQLAPDLQQNVIWRNERTKETNIVHHLRDFDRDYAMSQPHDPPYIWCNITTLVPRLWFDEIGGFDETMSSWEDVDLWYRMAWSGKDFHRIAEPLMLYRFTTGSRRQDGLHNWDSLLQYLRGKRKNYGM